MKINFKPFYILFYTNWLFTVFPKYKEFSGLASACFIFIRKSAKHDKGLLAHEVMHVRQFYRHPLLHLWKLMLRDHAYILEVECEAYGMQLAVDVKGVTNYISQSIA